MIFLGVLGTEKTFLTPEKPVGRVLVASNVQQSRGNQRSFSDKASCRRDGLVFAGFEMMGRNVGQNTLPGKPATTDALALLGHD